jgi:MarR family transcriptional regulator, 2-MHQ and catechol-resistance regulon repressor
MPTHYDGTPEEILALDTFIKLSRAMISFHTRLLARGQLDGLTISQFGVLEALYHLGTMRQGELSRKLLSSTGNMTMVLDNLEKNGLVKRIRSEQDRRMVQIELTHAGRERIEKVLPAHVEVIREEMAVLSPAEQAELGKLCRKLGRGSSSAGE